MRTMCIWPARFSLICVSGVLCCVSSLATHAASKTPPGKTRTYYVAADEVDWDYAPSGQDEAMGMPFDAVARGFTEPGPHQIGRVNKKAV